MLNFGRVNSLLQVLLDVGITVGGPIRLSHIFGHSLCGHQEGKNISITWAATVGMCCLFVASLGSIWRVSTGAALEKYVVGELSPFMKSKELVWETGWSFSFSSKYTQCTSTYTCSMYGKCGRVYLGENYNTNLKAPPKCSKYLDQAVFPWPPRPNGIIPKG